MKCSYRSIMVALIVTMGLIALTSSSLRAQVARADTHAAPHTHSPIVAGVVEWILPTVGYAYAGDWQRGLLPGAIRVASIATLVTAFDSAEDECSDGCAVVGLTAVAATVWSVVGSVKTARAFNRQARSTALPLSVLPSPGGGLSIGLHFGL